MIVTVGDSRQLPPVQVRVSGKAVNGHHRERMCEELGIIPNLEVVFDDNIEPEPTVNHSQFLALAAPYMSEWPMREIRGNFITYGGVHARRSARKKAIRRRRGCR